MLYGVTALRIRAHRLSYEAYKGPIPKGLLVCHHCDVTLCVNPDHLFVGTPKDNMDDMLRKGRKAAAVPKFGLAHPNAKFNYATIQFIRKSSLGDSEVARLTGVSRGHVWTIRHHRGRLEV